MKNKILKKSTHGGKRPCAGRTKRETAVYKHVYIEKSSVEFFTNYGGGYIGRGMDKAADFLENLRAVNDA